MSAKETDQREEYPSTFLEYDGTSLKAGLDVVRKWGVAAGGGAALGRRPGHGPAGGVQPLRPAAPDHGLLQPRRRQCDGSAFAEWRKWLHQNGPVLVLVAQDTQLPHLHRRPDDLRRRHGQRQPRRGAVGYGPDHFLLRSSWGTDWGDEGYARMSLDYAAQAVIESYGVMV